MIPPTVIQFLESFASKNISSSEDRLEETKRKKLAIKAQKLVELMMVSGIPTSSGFEERVRFSELEIVDANAIESGVLVSLPEGNYLNGWDVNVAGVRIISVNHKIRYYQHAVSPGPRDREPYTTIALANHRRAAEGIPTSGQEQKCTRALHRTAVRRLRQVA